MSLWYRVSQDTELRRAFSGNGGLYVAGRWNKLGRKAIYCSESISLCALEWLSHNGLSISGFSYYRYCITVPTELTASFKTNELPKEWNITPATNSTRNFAEAVLFTSEKYLAIAVPSVMTPEEYNLVINPSHKAFDEILKTAQELGEYIAPNR